MGILEDKREITGLWGTGEHTGELMFNANAIPHAFAEGTQCEKIEAYGEPVNYDEMGACEVPYFAIWVDGKIKYRVPAAGFVVEYAEDEGEQQAPAEFEPSPTDMSIED
jgi:hypothetical protein